MLAAKNFINNREGDSCTDDVDTVKITEGMTGTLEAHFETILE